MNASTGTVVKYRGSRGQVKAAIVIADPTTLTGDTRATRAVTLETNERLVCIFSPFSEKGTYVSKAYVLPDGNVGFSPTADAIDTATSDVVAIEADGVFVGRPNVQGQRLAEFANVIDGYSTAGATARRLSVALRDLADADLLVPDEVDAVLDLAADVRSYMSVPVAVRSVAGDVQRFLTAS